MAMMTKMRENMSAIFLVLVVVFLITIIFEWGMDYAGIKNTRNDIVGVVDGKKIMYQEFSELVKRQIDNTKQQSKQEPDENMLRQIREQVWNGLVTQILLEHETERAGVKVTDQEIVDWVKGDNPPEFLTRNFVDSTGRFNRQAYDVAIMDQRNKDIMVQVEGELKRQRLFEKMQSMVLSTIRATPGEIEQRFLDQNIKINAQYAFFDPNKFIADNAVSASDDDMKKIYNENQGEFKVTASRKLKYVLFADQPSAKDSEDVANEINSILQQAKSGLDFLELQKSYTDGQPTNTFFKHGELPQAKEDAAFSAHVGDVVGPIQDADGFSLIKILEEKKGTTPYVKAKHILLDGSTEKEAESMKLAKELIARAKKGENFSELAKKYSTEPGAANSGGELGWFGKGRMVKEFEAAALKGKKGNVIGPVKTQFGIHIIKIEGRDNRELKLASITIPLKASAQTKDAAFQRAQDFVYVAKKGNFEKDAESFGLKVNETPDFQKGGFIPGLGVNESISKFAFNGDLGDLSDVFQVNNGYVVAKISDLKKEGVRPFEEVKDVFKMRALRKKKMEQLKPIVQQKRAGLQDGADLSVLASDANISVQSTGEYSLGGNIPTVGREFAFTGAAKALSIGSLSQPVEGLRGYYIIKVLSKTPLDSSAFNIQKGMLAAQILQEKKQRVLNDWIEKLKEKAKIEDNRDNFYR